MKKKCTSEGLSEKNHYLQSTSMGYSFSRASLVDSGETSLDPAGHWAPGQKRNTTNLGRRSSLDSNAFFKRGRTAYVPVNRIDYYFEHILCYDLLFKLNLGNIMQIPKIGKILIIAQDVPYTNLNNIRLGLEIFTGQKAFSTISLGANLNTLRGLGKNRRREAGLKSTALKSSASPRGVKASHLYRTSKGTNRFATSDGKKLGHPHVSFQSDSSVVYCSLSSRTMYNFLDKLISLRLSANAPESFSDYTIQGTSVIQINLNNREVRSFPEIQNHFEFFESFKSIQIKIITSSKNEKETELLWAGLQQKEI